MKIHRTSDDSRTKDGLNLYINDNRFYISNSGKIIELDVFQIYVMSIKNGINAREEVARIYKW